MIEKIFAWAWKCGLDVQLTSITLDYNYYTPLEREEIDYANPRFTVVNQPCIIFSKNNQKMSVVAKNWAEMLEQLKHRHRHIFQTLCVPPLDLEMKKSNPPPSCL